VAGDGIGTEVVAQALKVLRVVLPGVETTDYDLGAARYHRTGEVLPDSVLQELRGHDAIVLGAVGDPSVPPGVLERGLLLKLRFDFDQYVNLRPSRLWPGTTSPLAGVKAGEIDLVVVREGTEGLYVGAGGNLHPGTAAEVATEESLNTRHGVERVIRDAFARAAKRPRRKVTLVHKTNVLTHAGGLWARTFDAVKAEFPDIETEYQHVDAAAMFLVSNPQRCSVTFSPTSPPPSPAASGWPPAVRSTQSGCSRRCSSPCTARRRTSRARAWPTRPPPCCPPRCCWTTSGTPRRRRA
jgi:3-isopropylmalate dehydrogenase